MGFDMGMGMGMGFWANPATGGYVPPANPELSDALAREIESFELDFKRQLEEGAGTYKTVAPSDPADSAGPSSAGEETKVSSTPSGLYFPYRRSFPRCVARKRSLPVPCCHLSQALQG